MKNVYWVVSTLMAVAAVSAAKHDKLVSRHDCPEHGHWNKWTKSCVCDDGYTWCQDRSACIERVYRSITDLITRVLFLVRNCISNLAVTTTTTTAATTTTTEPCSADETTAPSINPIYTINTLASATGNGFIWQEPVITTTAAAPATSTPASAATSAAVATTTAANAASASAAVTTSSAASATTAAANNQAVFNTESEVATAQTLVTLAGRAAHMPPATLAGPPTAPPPSPNGSASSSASKPSTTPPPPPKTSAPPPSSGAPQKASPKRTGKPHARRAQRLRNHF
ncbi:uncharacterized protein BJ171DRAFT_580738 [Polychytrium aggregatum]|uniref:uncharacterized protein n=1 Tax=Polychytrium aggregatum TaxID=110093 RepID=UPI0022FE5384|nr:uncharacterized protein BJ171DRAFT_580738 [Polychytrium aggregatum]KAI9205563.1 hypothetical protein BJ171DRAFT_580738 [Polychytrium aggregatum]